MDKEEAERLARAIRKAPVAWIGGASYRMQTGDAYARTQVRVAEPSALAFA